MRKGLLFILTVAIAFGPAFATAQGKWNFPDRKAIVLDISPHIKITSFTFENTLEGRISSSRNSFTYQWRNAGTVPVLAFELVTLKYDPFDEPMTGSRTLVSGKNSADFTPLQPGESSGDGTIGYGHTHVLTAIVYVRAVRFVDGTLWRADPSVVVAEVKKAAPGIKDAGPLVPEREKKDEKKP
ncbi:MAG: hypothetical protein HY706_21955 [Candidatus Hydrogenedentes bacterium]|nr:hypothetical protein [Candidatus Hydrogenedentota bacterium]